MNSTVATGVRTQMEHLIDVAESMGLLALSVLLGAVIGLERERQGKSAGLRTHALVSLGSALFTLISIRGFGGVAAMGGRDPARVAAQIVTGVGFLGAGTIMHEGITIRGLTTAASLWTTAGIGMAAGSGMVAVAMAGTVLVHLVLALMARLERRYFPHEATVLRLKAIDRPGLLGEVATEIGRFGLNIVATDVNVDREDATVTIEINISHENAKYVGRSPYAEILQHVLALPGVLQAEMDNW